jgi:adenosine deaminase
VSLESYIQAIPKVELHVHLEGSIQPATLLALARRNGVPLPASSVDGLRQWYRFTSFDHFIEVYLTISSCIRTEEDIELIAREFLLGQAAQNVVYSEVTYTAFTHYQTKGLPFEKQLAAINRARAWAAGDLGVDMNLVIDISRVAPVTSDEVLLQADWVINNVGNGVVALGLGGPEVGYPPEEFAPAFARARAAGVPGVPHAGETVGPASIWGAIRALHAVRIGHGVRCLEDPALVEELRARQIPLEVCPTSNVCLGVAPSLEQHPLPHLVAQGLYVTVNSDDPPMFDTSLNDEYLALHRVFGFTPTQIEELDLNAVRATLLPATERAAMAANFKAAFARLWAEHGL